MQIGHRCRLFPYQQSKQDFITCTLEGSPHHRTTKSQKQKGPVESDRATEAFLHQIPQISSFTRKAIQNVRPEQQ